MCSVRSVCGLLLLCCCTCSRGDELFPTLSTMDLVSVLRRDLLADNDDFTQHRPAGTWPPSAPHYIHHPRSHTSTHHADIAPHPARRHPGWRRLNGNNVTDTPKKTEYLLPNKLIGDDEQQFSRMRSRSKAFVSNQSTTTHTTTEGVKIFYESVQTGSEVAPQLRASVRPARLFSKTTAFERDRLVIDEHKLLAAYSPFTGSNIHDMKEFLATKFFEIVQRPREPLARLVPTAWTSPSPAAAQGGDSADPRLLDTAHARGPRLLDLRRKHRLCDRNILFPEGPKYDGRRPRRFDRRRAPAHVLPRCCNCCRKSVLGCE